MQRSLRNGERGGLFGRVVAVVVAVVVAGALGCRDHRTICGRARELIAAADEDRLAVELPGIADAIVRNHEHPRTIDDCGDELFQWIAAALDARPVDLRPGLKARVAALGAFVASDEWNQRATAVAARLLLGDPQVEVHLERHFIGAEPGLPKLWDEAVSHDDLDTWAAAALVGGHVGRGFSTSSPLSPRDPYADLLATYFAQRYAAPPTDPALLEPRRFALGGAAPRRTPPPPSQLGCREAALDLLWLDLVKAYRTAPDHPRWRQLPVPLRLHLTAPTSIETCRFAPLF